MSKALAAFNKNTLATTKHMIIVSDGDPSGPAQTLLSGFVNAPPIINGKPKGIQISTVAIGTHGAAGNATLQRIANATGGKYYVVNNPSALPRIYQREVRRVARPLIYEKPVAPQIVYRHEMLNGIDAKALPVIKGFVLTEKKENPLVEYSILSDQPEGDKNNTVLASWTYGLGRTVVFTTDTGRRWAPGLKDWEYHDQFFQQMIEWSMRPTTEQGKFNVATTVKDGKVQIIVNALDKDDEFLNFISNFTAKVTTPDNRAMDVSMEQVAPGRYIGEFSADDAGSYLFNVTGLRPPPGTERERRIYLQGGVSVPYSDEYRARETNRALLDTLASLKPAGGDAGKVIEGEVQRGNLDSLLSIDTFRHTLAKAVSSNDIWPWLVFGLGCIFLADVFVRRVQVGWEWLTPVKNFLSRYVLRRQPAQAPDERMARLKSRKQEVAATHDERRAAARFEPTPEAPVDMSALDEASRAAPPQREAASGQQQMTPAQPEAETYTERLLKAKQQARRGKK
jgi:hypothetical protein